MDLICRHLNKTTHLSEEKKCLLLKNHNSNSQTKALVSKTFKIQEEQEKNKLTIIIEKLEKAVNA